MFDRFFSRADEAPLPGLAALLEARGLPGELPGLAALAPGFEAHRKAEEREAWVAAVAELHGQDLPLPEPWVEAQDHLLPELVPAWQAEREGLWCRGFIDGLSQRIRVGDRVMPAAWLTLWDQSADDVLELALDHLKHRSEGSFERLPSGAYRSPWRDGLDAARLLLPELWHGLFKDQHPFLAIPSADTLLAVPQILLPKLMDEVGRSLQSGAKPLQLAVIERIHDKLMTARLQDPHPMSAPQRELKHMDLLQALRQQELDLDPALGLPATVSMVKTSQGKPLTMALWNEGAPILLPETDLIAFSARNGEPLGIFTRQTLPRIHELKGEAVSIWGPRRVRYEGFPTADQLSRLEQFATAEQMKSLQTPAGNRGAAPRPGPGPGAPFNSQGAAPLPRHLQGAGLGVQDSE
ncbi:MAG: hypothetical protein IPO28_06460 [Holophagaceae bacterium]|uniref:Uncharacterized protein n=1 Tax=Candidatus Geothrix odensensis TaxID=2954440 RepID=A0A936F0T6_9BACT|nr:hypothetical protein [Candidatus Geothrix odensensis]MBK8789812.1 hypothetical protein [Holophagaceae bacterium]